MASQLELTPREIEAARLVAEGHSNANIATALEISFHTAKFHVGNVMKKLGANNRAQVAAEVVRRGL